MYESLRHATIKPIETLLPLNSKIVHTGKQFVKKKDISSIRTKVSSSDGKLNIDNIINISSKRERIIYIVKIVAKYEQHWYECLTLMIDFEFKKETLF